MNTWGQRGRMQSGFRLSSVAVGLLAYMVVILAVLVVLGIVAAIVDVDDHLLDEALTVSPEWYAIMLLTAVLGAFLGGLAAARLSPDAPMRHALALGVAALVYTYISVVPAESAEQTLGPLLLLPAAWLGGKLAVHVARAAAAATGGAVR